MQKWIIPANGNKYKHLDAFAKFGYIDWAQKAKFTVGDEVYIYCTRPYKRIKYKTRVLAISIPFEKAIDDKEFWYDMTKYEQDKSGVYVRLELIALVDNENLSLKSLRAHGLNGPPQRPTKMKKELIDYVDRFFHNNSSTIAFNELEVPFDCHEGTKTTIEVNKYERNPIARRECIKIHGCKCFVCGMDFEEKYGEIGKGFIHVHHKIPLHSIGNDYIVNYKEDMIPVCPNCHAMLHHGENGEVLSPEKLKEKIKINADNK